MNVEILWSGGKFKILLCGDILLIGNGVIYMFDLILLYDLIDDDFFDFENLVWIYCCMFVDVKN